MSENRSTWCFFLCGELQKEGRKFIGQISKRYPKFEKKGLKNWQSYGIFAKTLPKEASRNQNVGARWNLMKIAENWQKGWPTDFGKILLL